MFDPPTEAPWDADIVLQEQFAVALNMLADNYMQRGLHVASVVVELNNLATAIVAGAEHRENQSHV